MTSIDDGFDAAARNLVGGYCQTLDARDLEGLVALFAHDGVVVTSGNEKTGRDGIRAWYVEVFEKNPQLGYHVLSNTVTRLDGPGRGSARSDEMFHRKNEAGIWTPVVRYVYLDQFVVEDGRWVIARHEMLRNE